MGKVNIAHVDEALSVPFPPLAGVSSRGSIATRAVFSKPDRPLWLWTHELSPGAQICWEQPVVGHTIYVWKGNVTVGEKRLAPAAVVCIEHKGAGTIEACENGATLVHFHRQEALPALSAKAGGNTHVVGANGILKVRNEEYDVTTTFWLDARCATCDSWLHQSKIVTPRPQTFPHFHTEDEIIFVVQGGMILGRRVLKPGGALAIDAGTIYAFGVDEGGLAFLNFRPVDPHFVMVSRDGPKHAPISEREHMAIGTLVA